MLLTWCRLLDIAIIYKLLCRHWDVMILVLAGFHAFHLLLFNIYDLHETNKGNPWHFFSFSQCSGIKKASSGHSADDHRAPKMNNLPPTSSTGSSSASSVSDNALDDEVISSTENSASDLQGGEPPSVNLMDILSKAKLAYDKVSCCKLCFTKFCN